jgi:hypothetical protein
MLRFTIRDLLWLMVVVGLICWGWTERRSRVVAGRSVELSREQLEALVCLIEWDGYQVDVGKSVVSITKGNTTKSQIGIGHSQHLITHDAPPSDSTKNRRN